MKHNTKHPMILAGLMGTALVTSTQAATILTDHGLGNNAWITPNPGNPSQNNINFGSNLAGTPDIGLLWETTGGQWQSYGGWPNGGDDVFQMDGAQDTGNEYAITFSATSGFNVILTSLDINVWGGGGDFDINWSVDGTTSGSMGSGSITATDGGVTNINFGNLTGSGSEDVTMTLTIGNNTGLGSYLAMDNLSFDQVAAVPEPSSSVLAAVGLGALAMRRRRQ